MIGLRNSNPYAILGCLNRSNPETGIFLQRNNSIWTKAAVRIQTATAHKASANAEQTVPVVARTAQAAQKCNLTSTVLRSNTQTSEARKNTKEKLSSDTWSTTTHKSKWFVKNCCQAERPWWQRRSERETRSRRSTSMWKESKTSPRFCELLREEIKWKHWYVYDELKYFLVRDKG